MGKTLSILNTKVWYRVLKVFFIFTFIVVIITGNAVIIYEGVGRIDHSKTKIYCNGLGNRIFTANQAGVDFENYEFIQGFDYKKFYEGYYNEYDIKYILEACYPGILKYHNDDIYLIQKVLEIKGFKSNPKQYSEDYLSEQINNMTGLFRSKTQKTSSLDYSLHSFDIVPVYTYGDFFKYFIIINISVLAFFEVIRRVFYYIVIGTIKPRK